jgi:stage V sporulation protein SpoVS
MFTDKVFTITDMSKYSMPRVAAITAENDGQALKKFAQQNKFKKSDGWELVRRSTFHELFCCDDEGRVVASYVAE